MRSGVSRAGQRQPTMVWRAPSSPAGLGSLHGSLNSAPGPDHSLEGDRGHGGGSPAQAPVWAHSEWVGLWLPETVRHKDFYQWGANRTSAAKGPRPKAPGRGRTVRRPGTTWEDLALGPCKFGELPRQGHPRQLGS